MRRQHRPGIGVAWFPQFAEIGPDRRHTRDGSAEKLAVGVLQPIKSKFFRRERIFLMLSG
jgi:hypothetical protein